VTPIGRRRRISARLRLIPSEESTPLSDEFTIGFPMIADDTEHTYMLCTELNSAWRDRKWGAIRLEIDAEKAKSIKLLAIQVGH
jgi:hypothetical protein